MRHRRDGKKLNRTTSHRKALWRNMAASLFQHGAIRTTEAKAKQLRRFVEKLITTAKKNTLHARRQVIKALNDREMFDDSGESTDQTVVQKLFSEIAPRYANRPGGYTRIIHLAERRIGDAGRQVVLQLVEEESAEGDSSGGGSRRKARAAKRHDAAAAVAAQAPAEDVAELEAEAPVEDAAAEAPAENVDAEEQTEDPESKDAEEVAEDAESEDQKQE